MNKHISCWYSKEKCPRCGGTVATNGKELWCVDCFDENDCNWIRDVEETTIKRNGE